MHRRTLTIVALALVLLAGPAVYAQDVQSAPPESGAPSAAPTTPTNGAPPTGQPTPDGQKAPPPRQDNPLSSPYTLLILGAGMVALWLWSSRNRRKTEATRQEMLASLKKGDKVTSIGGIIGTIIEAREDEVVLKVDENTNTRMHMARWAIRGVGDDARKTGPEEQRR